MSSGNELTSILLLDGTCIRYRQARTLWHQRETQLLDAIVDVHLMSFKQLESGGSRDSDYVYMHKIFCYFPLF